MFKVKGRRTGDIEYKVLKFSGGEIQPKILTHIQFDEHQIFIQGNVTSSDEFMELSLLTDALRRSVQHPSQIFLTVPYLPYARQDRVCDSGESLAIKVFCNLINNLGFESVTIWDVHSDVSLALLDRVTNVHQKKFVKSINWTDVVLVAPDAGAIKKTLEVSKDIGFPLVRADKIRSAQDGSITGTVVYSDHIGDSNFLIVDDICDGGRTFIELAKVLKPLTNGKVYLYVTHGIFSKGLDVFDGLIDGVYTPNPFPGVDLNHKLLVVIK